MKAARARLEQELGGIVRTDPETLAAHRHDSWVLAELADLGGEAHTPPLAVIQPRSVCEVQRALRLCRELGLAVVPFGGGSGVCGAIRPSPGEVVLSMARLQGVLDIDSSNLTARFRAGTLGSEAERLVCGAGLTIGHWPQSIEVSTVGGWVATRAAGQYSTGYGNIEDLVLAIEVVLPDGSILRTRATPRASAGPDLRQLFMGSEGTLGVITEVTFSLRSLPEASQGQAFHFGSLEAGLEAIRRTIRDGWRPPVVRLYDAPESRRHFGDFCPERRCMLILLHEGPAAAVRTQCEAVGSISVDAEGIETDPASVDHWLAERNRVPSLRGLLEKGIIADTIELACTWDRVGRLYDEVTRAILELPDVLLATAHSSHSYRSGTNLYFTFAARAANPGRLAALYRECWFRAMQVAVRLGAGISHHHGIGRVRREVLVEEIGDSGVAVLRAVKRALDPDGLLNPGALLPDPESGAP